MIKRANPEIHAVPKKQCVGLFLFYYRSVFKTVFQIWIRKMGKAQTTKKIGEDKCMGKEKKGKNIGFDIGKKTRTIRFIAAVMAMTFVFIHFGSSVIDVSGDGRWKEGILRGEENSEEAVEDTAEKAEDHTDHEYSESGAYVSDSDNKYASEFQRESAEREQEAREKTIESQKEELVQDKGLYSEDSIVLENTSKEEAERIAEKLGAKVRTTAAGDFAVLYLPEGMTIEDVYNNDELAVEVTKMSPDYYISADSITDNSAALSSISISKDINDEDETEGENQEEPYIPRAKVLKTRPNYQADDSYYGSQQYLDYLNIQDTWTKTKGSGIKVAIIDSGIDTDHPEFAERISEMSYYASQDKVVKDYDMSIIEDEQGHGTAVAGVLAASIDNAEGIAGIAPEVELVIIKCDVDSSGEFVRGSDAVLGLAYAIEQDVDIINMSFRASVDMFSKYTKLAVDSDIICIASAGNDGSSIPVYPASLDSVIAVGAYDTDNDMLCDYSNYGENVDILAPGTAYTTQINGEYGLSTGTSISAPIAAGAAALYMSLNGKAEFSTMLELFRASSVDIGTLGEDYRNGYGELDINALVCEEKGTITYDMLTDEVPNQTQIFVKGHTVQSMPEPERLYVVYDGWFFDPNCTDECELYTNIFQNDVTLYASWINEDEGSVFSYTTKADGTIDIRSYTGKRRYITVPSVIEGKQVTSIGERAFADNQRLRTVMLPESLRVIDDWAFTNCTMLRTVVVPDSVKSIGQESFSGCSRLSLVDIANTSKLASIGERAFAFTGINEFYIPSGMNSLGGYAFYGSTGLRSVSIAGGNTTYQIISNAIYNVSGDTLIYYPAGLSGEYTIPEGTVNIGDAAFAYTRSTMVQLNDGLKSIGKEGFAYGRVGSASFPESLEVMGAYVYSNSNRLSSVTFSENGSLTKIADYAFNGTCSLKSIVIPQYIIELGDCSFSGSGLTEAIFEENSTLSLIGMSAFSCTQIKEIDIPDSVLVISGCAFSSCWELTSVSFGNNSNCQSILYSAFSYDERLKNIILPDSLKILGENAFYNSGLTSITIGSGLTELGYGVFASCKNLSEISVSSDNPNYTSYEGVLYNKDKSILLLFPAGRAGEYSLPVTVIRIERYGFSGADKLTTVNLNEGLTEIGEFAFENCKALQIPMFPSTLTEIESYAFMLCEGMTGTLLIPKKTKHIGYFAFFYDYNITDIDFEPESEMDRFGYGAFGYCGIEDFTIPRNISTMGQEVFVGCNKLLAVTFESESKLEYLPAWSFSGADNLRRITFESDSEMTHIEARACESLTQLEMVDLSGCNKLKDIDNYAFRMCVSLTGMDLPEIIENIGRYAFYGCSSMSEIRLPETVNHIGRYAFSKTNSINLYFASAVLPENLEENWDSGIGAYYVGVDKVQENDDWFYAVTPDGKASVIKYKGASSEVVLDNIDGHEVVSIGGEAFLDNTSVTSVTLPTSLTGIYKAAFKGTTALKSIVIPANVKVIGSEAFSGSGIESVTFETGSKLTSIESMAFEGTNNLTGIVIPNGVTQIKEKTFYGSGIKSITIPDNVTEIGRLSFAESGLEFVAIPASVTDISYYAFKNTKALTDVNFASTEAKETLAVTNSIAGKLMIRDEVFYGSGLLSVNVPKYVNYIGNLVFSNCKNLTEISVDDENLVCASLDGVLYDKTMSKLITCPAGKTGSYTLASNVAYFALGAFEGSQLSEITIPEESSLITIGHRTFYGCKNLTSINIPDSVQSVEYYAFAYCDNLETVSINSTSQLGGIYEGAFYNCAKLSSIVIPDTVLEISDYAFYGCSALKEVTFSENSKLQGIYDHAFEYAGIENFVMPIEMTELGAYAFHGAGLKTFEFNEVLLEIGEYALADAGLNEMCSLIIPNSVENIGIYAFAHLDSIENLTLPFLGKNRNSTYEEATLRYIWGEDICKVNTLSIQGGSNIGYFAFNNSLLKEVVLAESIKVIEDGAFSGCYDLEHVNIPANVINIGYATFVNCRKLRTIIIPEACVSIGHSAFSNCKELSNLFIPKNVSQIGNEAFNGCEELESIIVDSQNRYFKSINGILYDYNCKKIIFVPKKINGEIIIPNGVEEVGDSAFQSCEGITSVTIPASVKKVGDFAFSKCSSLSEVSFSYGIELIGVNAFEYCMNLKTVELPDSVTEIGAGVFSCCCSLSSIYISNNITSIPYAAFLGCGLIDVDIPNSVKSIGLRSFEGCGSLKSVAIPSSLTSIDDYAFLNCLDIKQIYIPENVSSIGSGAFSECTSLERIIVDESNNYYISNNGILYDKAMTRILFVPNMISGTVNIPEGIIVAA